MTFGPVTGLEQPLRVKVAIVTGYSSGGVT
jgi:hypothetical protein